MEASAAVAYRRQFQWYRRWSWAGATAAAAIGLAILAYLYRTPLRAGFDLLVEETGGARAAVVCLVLALALAAWLVVWLILPILVWRALRDLRRRAAELDETTKLCARHLSRLASTQEPSPHRGVAAEAPRLTSSEPEAFPQAKK
jgi:hypothetical protein